MTRTHTNNLALGYGSLRWNDSKQQIKDLFPQSLESGNGVVVGDFLAVEEHVSMTATLHFNGGELAEIELAPSIGDQISDWRAKRLELVNMYGALAESNEKADISIDSDWGDVNVSIRRKPLRR